MHSGITPGLRQALTRILVLTIKSSTLETKLDFRDCITFSEHSRTPLTRTPKGNEKLFELAGVRINRSWCQISFTMLIINKV